MKKPVRQLKNGTVYRRPRGAQSHKCKKPYEFLSAVLHRFEKGDIWVCGECKKRWEWLSNCWWAPQPFMTPIELPTPQAPPEIMEVLNLVDDES